MIYIPIHIVFFFLAWMNGGKKGKGVAGFWLGLIFGPLGWVFTLLMSDANVEMAQMKVAQAQIDQMEEQKAQVASQRKCPACLGDVPKEAKKCMHCGTELPVSQG